MHSRATDRKSASKCQGKWPDQTLDQAFGLPEVLVAVSTSRLSRCCAMRLCLKMSGGRVLMRQLLVCFSILFLLGDSAYWARGDMAGTPTTWSQGLTLGANGPIPVIVVDQFGYPTKASKIAVIRDPQMGYDNVVSFTPGTTYAVVDKST